MTSSPYSPLFYSLLKLYHYFPLHAPATTFIVNGSWGKFATQGGKKRFYLDGNRAWAAMEVVSPLTFIAAALANARFSQLTRGTRIAAGMYLFHYSMRAIISPLVLAPPRAPQHLTVTLAAIFFNLMNGYMVGSFIGSDPVGQGWERTPWFWVLVAGWAVGLFGNVYHDEILHSLRRPSIIFNALPFLRPSRPADPAAQTKKKEGTEKERGKTYEIPTGGLFYWVTQPNYLCEWFEWTCFALLTSPNPFLQVPTSTSSTFLLTSSSYPSFLNTLLSALSALPYPFKTMLTPPWMFLLAELTAMIPRALNTQRWYEVKFGDEWDRSGRKGGRWVCLPGLI